MSTDNLAMVIGYKGSGLPKAIGVYQDHGALLLGGFASPNDAQVTRFGKLASANPNGTDGEFFMGIPTGYASMGLLIYEAGIAQNDPARLGVTVGEYLPGQPITIMQFGQIWMATFTTVALGAIQPTLGAVVIVNTTTGDIEFLPNGALVGQVPSGFALLPQVTIKSVSNDTSGALLLVNF